MTDQTPENSHDRIPNNLMAKIRIMADCDDVREIPGFPLYAATRNGQVWSVCGKSKTGLRETPYRLKPFYGKKKYPSIVMRKNGTSCSVSLTRCIALAFISNPPSKEANAILIDGDYTNICPENVMWASNSQKTKKAIERGTLETVSSHRVKLNAERVEEIHQMRQEGHSLSFIAQHFGVTVSAIQHALRGRTWSSN